MAINIQDANISVRTYNCLKRAGYTTLEEVAQAGEEKIARVRNLGAACLEELKTVMPSYGLAFAEKEGDAQWQKVTNKKPLRTELDFIELSTMNDGRPLLLRVDRITAITPCPWGEGEYYGTLIYAHECNEENHYWVSESYAEVIGAINQTRR